MDHAQQYRWRKKLPRKYQIQEIVAQVWKGQYTVNRLIRRVYSHTELVKIATRNN